MPQNLLNMQVPAHSAENRRGNFVPPRLAPSACKFVTAAVQIAIPETSLAEYDGFSETNGHSEVPTL